MIMITRAATVGGRSALRSAPKGAGSTTVPMLLRNSNDYHRRNGASAACQFLHNNVVGGSPLDEDRRRREQQQQQQQQQNQQLVLRRDYHSTTNPEKGVALVLGLGSVSALAYAGSSAVKAYNEYKASLPSEEEMEEMRKQQEKESEAERQQREAQAAAKKEQEKKEGKRENIFAKWFGVGVGAKYYEGGFEEVMTRREAALILGVRESSPAARIKDAHRKLLVLNHPDTGGSTYVAGKINEAKELLLKGKRGK